MSTRSQLLRERFWLIRHWISEAQEFRRRRQYDAALRMCEHARHNIAEAEKLLREEEQP